MTDNKADNNDDKKQAPQPQPRKIQKPLNPLAQKPGQNYSKKDFDKEPPYNPDMRK